MYQKTSFCTPAQASMRRESGTKPWVELSKLAEREREREKGRSNRAKFLSAPRQQGCLNKPNCLKIEVAVRKVVANRLTYSNID